MSVKFTRAVLLIALCALSACKGREDTVEQSETRTLEGFNAIDLKGGAELAIDVGKTQSVKVRATHETLSHLRTEVRDHTLIVRRDSDDWSFGRSRGVNLTISVPKLTSVKLEGGNHVMVNGLDGGDVAFEVRGATSIDASGKVESLRIHMQGAGEANFSKLIAQDVDVTVEGVGKVTVNAQEKLAATMNGLGAIRYSGHPADVSTRLNGFGSISQADDGDASPPAAKKPPPNPADLQPEYEEKKTSDENSTEVI
ncbi:MAG TPA: head GIN domain-containing protein [Steroidobacteraceae bacterium]|nr:head GIN domain-containing protein [Steroidobacteraceae bacterium]